MVVTKENVRHLIIVHVKLGGLVWIVQPVLKNLVVYMDLALKHLSVIVILDGPEVIAKRVSTIIKNDCKKCSKID